MGDLKLSDNENDPVIDSKTPFLVVDDSKPARQLVIESLRKIGFDGDIFDVSGLEDAQKILKKHKIKFILCDWQLDDGKEGIELLDAVRKVSKNVPFIMITSQDDAKDILKAIDKGASEYLVKPCNQENLKEKILNAVKNQIAKIA